MSTQQQRHPNQPTRNPTRHVSISSLQRKKCTGANRPPAPFVENVSEWVSTRSDVEGVLKNFQEMISKYQFMQVNTERRQAGLKGKIPDIEKTLETVQFLQRRGVS